MPSFFSRAAAPGAPLICTGDHSQARLQIEGYRAVFAHLLRTESIPHGFRWIFRAQSGLAEQLRGLAEREADCCRFMSIDLTDVGDGIVWESTGNASASPVIDEIARLPERLRDEPRAGHDLAALKRGAEAAGLVFTPATARS